MPPCLLATSIFHGQPDPFPLFINIQHPDLHFLIYFDDLFRVADKLIGHLADVNQTVLMDAYINESPECRDVRHDARQNHSGHKVFDSFYALCKFKNVELLTWISAWFCQSTPRRWLLLI